MTRLVRHAAVAFVVALGLVGCPADKPPGGPVQPAITDALTEVGTMVRLYSGKNGRGPSKPADLAEYENGCPVGYAAVQSGDIVIRWGKTMGGEGAKGTDEVIAYEKKALTEGGHVLLHNGGVKKMEAAELAPLGLAVPAK